MNEPRTRGDIRPMGCYLLSGDRGLYLVFGQNAVSAASTLNTALGQPDADTEVWSVSGSWDAVPGTVLNVGRWWPMFTADPPQRYTREDK